MFSAKDAFKKEFPKNHFTRVSADHPFDLFVGADSEGRHCLKFTGHFTPVNVQGSAYIDVEQYRNLDSFSLFFSLNDEQFLPYFLIFCDDIVNTTASKAPSENAYEIIINRYYSWKKLFSGKGKVLSEQEIQGLIGELSFLDNHMIPKYGMTLAVNSWSGPDYAKKDFSVNDDWFEIKAVFAGKNSVKISSIQQLESNNEGRLVVYSLEKLSPSSNGVDLNTLIGKISSELTIQEVDDIFMSKLANVGYESLSQYFQYKYEIKGVSFYKVDKQFPIIRSSSLDKAIVGVQYDLDLTEISQYLERRDEK